MKKILLLSSLFIFLFSCTTSNKNEIPLFNDKSFHLLSSERVIPLNKLSSDEFQEYLGENSLPLLKYVKGENYHLFLAIPYGQSLPEINKKKFIANDSLLISSKVDSSHFLKKHYLDHNFISELGMKIDKANGLYILGISSDSLISDSILNSKSLLSRIK